MEAISSRHNPIVKSFRACARANGDGDVILEGSRLIHDALSAGVRLRTVAFGSGRVESPDPDTRMLLAALRESGARVVSASPAVMAALSPVRTPSGVVAIAEYHPLPLERTLGSPPQLVLALVGLQDPGNVGAVIRAADAAGATGVIACEQTANPFGWKALRGAMGSTFRIPVAVSQPVAAVVAAARGQGLRVLCAAPRRGRSLHAMDLTRPTIVLLGGEGAGLDEDVERLADERLSIPMRDSVDSLNVAASAALIVYEAYRQRHGH